MSESPDKKYRIEGGGDAGTGAIPENITVSVPTAEIEVDGQTIGMAVDPEFVIRLEGLCLPELFDQSRDMVESCGQGCISTPGGPSC
ncbi:hypothetical protein AB0B78_23265 [Streptomyces sp. NPDC040724]|uniref:hypothetical protein n=1 Tax=Streptomyces sp. NPDC040724 TaxID=3155612 RepID=UPI0033FD08CF